ncbi:hypothetical protein [uncultured Methanobacterium sp.]|uniref:hypothetical protein n=1 Tax=uncultured Methanobacterium sp. TaxID=176306 RepID=UPI002AA896E9|nr:hypothetical protein [uncultured Methanobacterium sp.]
MTDIYSEINEIKLQINGISEKLDILLEEKEIMSIMKLSEKSLSSFLSEEPDIYCLDDLKVRYK